MRLDPLSAQPSREIGYLWAHEFSAASLGSSVIIIHLSALSSVLSPILEVNSYTVLDNTLSRQGKKREKKSESSLYILHVFYCMAGFLMSQSVALTRRLAVWALAEASRGLS